MIVTAKARVFPTEDGERVRRALLNIFPTAETAYDGDVLVATARDLDRFREVLRNHRILDSARAVLLRGLSEDGLRFQLNKQAAFVGKVSFVEGGVPLGAIEVLVADDALEALIDDVAPRTVDGEVP